MTLLSVTKLILLEINSYRSLMNHIAVTIYDILVAYKGYFSLGIAWRHGKDLSCNKTYFSTIDQFHHHRRFLYVKSSHMARFLTTKPNLKWGSSLKC